MKHETRSDQPFPAGRLPESQEGVQHEALPNEAHEEGIKRQMIRLEEQINLLEQLIIHSHMRDIAYHFTKKSAIIKVNILAGVARGIGLTIGTAIFLALTFYLLSYVVSLPIVGEHIAEWLDTIDHYRQFNSFDFHKNEP